MGIGTRIIDGMFSAFSPRAAIRRNYDRRQLAKIEAMGAELDRRRRDALAGGGYHSAEKSRDSHSWMTSRLSPDSSLEADRDEMCLHADSAYKNYELATNHVEGRVVRVAGSGMTVEPEIGFDAKTPASGGMKSSASTGTAPASELAATAKNSGKSSTLCSVIMSAAWSGFCSSVTNTTRSPQRR
jgi:hypothetical protein